MSVTTTETSYLYGWEHPDKMREFRKKHKSMAKKDKTTTIKDAIARGVKQEDYIVFGGMGSTRTPTAAVHEIIRQGIGDLTIASKWIPARLAVALLQLEILRRQKSLMGLLMKYVGYFYQQEER